jgi:triosephosphate isomerase
VTGAGRGGRRRIVAGNWKMNLLSAPAAAFCRELRAGLTPGRGQGEPRAEVLLFPSFPLIPLVVQEMAGSGVEIGGQDLHAAERGAHTGDVSGPQLADAGCRWALCGHSERRHNHHESDELVGAKVAAAARHGLTPVLCVGETLAQREAGETLAVLERQVRAGLAAHPRGGVPLVVAYEPVWAIGTGRTASPETAQEAHRFLRGLIAGLANGQPAPGPPPAGGAASSAAPAAGAPQPGAGPGAAATILYGGSVTPANAASLIAQPDVDGFLVGGASLDPGQFLAIIACSG